MGTESENNGCTKGEQEKFGTGKKSCIKNPYLNHMPEDVLYHLALSKSSHNLKEMFGDVKFVCTGGTGERMHTLAHFVCKELGLQDDKIEDICRGSGRYKMFKAGPVLCVNHAIGSPSISIVLHEVMKLLHHAGAQDVVFIRVGTCGGLGLEPGSLVITSEAVDGRLCSYQELLILGKVVRRPTVLDKDLVKELETIGRKCLPNCAIKVGKTMCANDFYEEQGRMDGAFCEFSEQEKREYLHGLLEAGVLNMEMESLTFAAMCTKAGYKAAVVCVTLVDRLKDDQVMASKEIFQKWEHQLMYLIIAFIKEKLQNPSKYLRV